MTYMLSLFIFLIFFINDDHDNIVEVGGNSAGQSSNRGSSDQDGHKVFIPFRAYSARKGVCHQYNTIQKNKNVVFLYSYNLSNFPLINSNFLLVMIMCEDSSERGYC